MKSVRYKILRKDDNQVFGPFVLGDDNPVISGNLEYLLFTTEQDTFGTPLYEGDRVSFSSDEGIGSDNGEVVWGCGAFSVKTRNNAVSLASCRFIKRLGSIYDKEATNV
jgi:hypothetical protein